MATIDYVPRWAARARERIEELKDRLQGLTGGLAVCYDDPEMQEIEEEIAVLEEKLKGKSDE